MTMKKEYTNVKKYDEKYYTIPTKFGHDLARQIAEKRGDFKYWTSVETISDSSGVKVDKHSLLEGEDVVAQFETRYIEKEEKIIIETI